MCVAACRRLRVRTSGRARAIAGMCAGRGVGDGAGWARLSSAVCAKWCALNGVQVGARCACMHACERLHGVFVVGVGI